MMQSLHSGFVGKIFRYLLIALLFGAGASLVMSDVGGFFRHGGVSRTDVAKVGDDEIGLVDFSRTMRRVMQQSGISEEQARQMGMPFMVLQQEITQRVLRQAAKQSGVRVSNQHVATELKKELTKINLPGTEKEKLDIVLQQQGMSESEFVDQLRNDFSMRLLASAVATPDLKLPGTLADAAYRLTLQKRNATLVQISAASLKNATTVTDKDIEAYYNENKARYLTPEKRSIAYITLPQKNFIGDVAVPEQDVKDYYEAHKDQFQNPERVRLSQLIVADEKTAKDIAAQKPTDLAAFKKDKDQYLPADWYVKPMLTPALQQALYPKEPTGLVGPIQSDMGWHVLLVEKYEAATAKDYADVKDIITRELKDRLLDEKLNGVTEQIESLIAENSSLEAVATEYKVEQHKLDDLTAQNIAASFKEHNVSDAVAARLAEAAFSLEENEISPIIDTKDGDMLLAQMTKVTPAQTPALETIKDQVKQDALKQKQRDEVDALANQLIRSFDIRNPSAFDAKRAALDLSANKLQGIERPAAVQKIGEEAANLLFTLTPESPLSSLPNEKGVLVVHLEDIVPYKGLADNSAITAQSNRVKDEVTQEVQQEFIDAWRRQLGTAINDKLMQQYFVEKQK